MMGILSPTCQPNFRVMNGSMSTPVLEPRKASKSFFCTVMNSGIIVGQAGLASIASTKTD